MSNCFPNGTNKGLISENSIKCAANNYWGGVNHVDSIPGEIVHRCPVFSVRETELWNDFQLVFSFSHKLKASFQLVKEKNQEFRKEETFTDLLRVTWTSSSPDRWGLLWSGCLWKRNVSTLRGNCCVTSGKYGTPALVLWRATTRKYSNNFLSCKSIKSRSKVRYRPVCLNIDWTDTNLWLWANIDVEEG